MPVDQILFGNKIFAAVTKRFRRYHTGGKAQPYSMNEGSYSKRRQVHRGNDSQVMVTKEPRQLQFKNGRLPQGPGRSSLSSLGSKHLDLRLVVSRTNGKTVYLSHPVCDGSGQQPNQILLLYDSWEEKQQMME